MFSAHFYQSPHKDKVLSMPNAGNNYFLCSERVGFRWWQPEDLELAMDLWGNAQVTRLFNKEPLTEAQVARRLTQEIESAKRYQIQYWPIYCCREDTHIGCAGLRYYAEGIAELGIHLKPEYWGRGFATEVGNRVIQHAFDNDLANALFAGHHPENKASRNVLIKLGFLGIPAQLYAPTDLFHPSYMLYQDPPECKTRIATSNDARALAIVHCGSINETFGGILDDYVEARSIDYCEERWEERFVRNSSTTLALVRGEQIVGFASIASSDDGGTVGLLERIYLHPRVLGSGHGNTLIHWCEQTLKPRGKKTIELWVFEVNARARHFYEKHGYKPDGCSKVDFGARLLRYSKVL
ncbi:MAG: GNAT family N-acetyltransferase [Candidatus Obscuribacterales bacterium]|nr:GNAT family N-acetyltransferase [Candidatus Obscuribacterales bacterium]